MRRGFGTRFQTSFAGSSAFEGTNTSLGNGNKMNMRLRILTNCLDEAEKTADVSKVNMYKDSITRSRCGLPIDAARSLDLMRQVNLITIAFFSNNCLVCSRYARLS